MFAVLANIFLTNKGKSLVPAHHLTSNTQLFYKQLVAHDMSSTDASIESADLIAYITTANIKIFMKRLIRKRQFTMAKANPAVL